MKYYPTSRLVTGSKTSGDEFTLNGIPYNGMYYSTFDGQHYTGNDPVTGKSEQLKPVQTFSDQPNMASKYLRSTEELARNYVKAKNIKPIDLDSFVQIIPYYPIPTELDYKAGFFFRYFAKKRNENGNLIETTLEVLNSLKNTNSVYNYELYHAIEIYWQLTGPLKDTVNTKNGVRTAGIENTNKRLVEGKDVVFKGLIAHIGGNYSKFSRPTK